MLKVALAQVNPTVGDLPGNAHARPQAARTARACGARGWCSPPSSRSPATRPRTCCCAPAFIQACESLALKDWRSRCSDLVGLHLVVGHPLVRPQRADARTKSRAVPAVFNAASVLTGRSRRRVRTASASCPTTRSSTSAATSSRAARPATALLVFEVDGAAPGRADLRGRLVRGAGARRRCAAGAEALCVLNASPFHLDKPAEREAAHGRARARLPACRCCTPTWWAGRTRWSSTARRSRWMPPGSCARDRRCSRSR
jgi:NAD+ synthase (glutamine-hydrolysing)